MGRTLQGVLEVCGMVTIDADAGAARVPSGHGHFLPNRETEEDVS